MPARRRVQLRRVPSVVRGPSVDSCLKLARMAASETRAAADARPKPSTLGIVGAPYPLEGLVLPGTVVQVGGFRHAPRESVMVGTVRAIADGHAALIFAAP